MSSKMKHKKRSRRSHNDVGWQTGFKRIAFEREQTRSEARSIRRRISNLVKKLKASKDEEEE